MLHHILLPIIFIIFANLYVSYDYGYDMHTNIVKDL
jgi:hypothetical protein